MWENILEELRAIRGALLRISAAFFLCIVVFFTISIHGSTIAEKGLEHIHSDFLPHSAVLVARSPLDPFLAEAVISLELASIVVLPLLAFELWHWLAPALYRHERRVLGGFLVASFLLIVFGAWFSYKFVLPALFSGLYGFLPPGVEPYFDVRSVADLAAGTLFTSSCMFLLPVAMAALSGIGLVKPYFWRKYFRHAILLALILSAIITPDGTGITMMLLAVPIVGLYALGYLGARFLARGRPSAQVIVTKTHHV
jgi:sec-independent protein translocase protein TatC